MKIRKMALGEAPALLPLVQDLWPDATDFAFKDDATLVADDGGVLCGFAMIAIRPYSNACEAQPCPHLEGWYVTPGYRKQGVGRALIDACEDWCREMGFTELGSDVLIDNQASLDAHSALGFEGVETVRYLRKTL